MSENDKKLATATAESPDQWAWLFNPVHPVTVLIERVASVRWEIARLFGWLSNLTGDVPRFSRCWDPVRRIVSLTDKTAFGIARWLKYGLHDEAFVLETRLRSAFGRILKTIDDLKDMPSKERRYDECERACYGELNGLLRELKNVAIRPVSHAEWHAQLKSFFNAMKAVLDGIFDLTTAYTDSNVQQLEQHNRHLRSSLLPAFEEQALLTLPRLIFNFECVNPFFDAMRFNELSTFDFARVNPLSDAMEFHELPANLGYHARAIYHYGVAKCNEADTQGLWNPHPNSISDLVAVLRQVQDAADQGYHTRTIHYYFVPKCSEEDTHWDPCPDSVAESIAAIREEQDTAAQAGTRDSGAVLRRIVLPKGKGDLAKPEQWVKDQAWMVDALVADLEANMPTAAEPPPASEPQAQGTTGSGAAEAPQPPQPEATKPAAAGLPESPSVQSEDTCPVQLRGLHEPVVVCGKEKPALKVHEREAVSRLVDAYPNGLTKDRLEEGTCAGARKHLKDLRNADTDWKAVIHFPGKKGKGGYMLVWPREGVVSIKPE